MRKSRFRFKIWLGLFFCLVLFGTGPYIAAQEPNPAPPPGPDPSPIPGPGQEEKKPKKAVAEDRNSFTINFKDVELEQIIKTFSDITGKNFILEQIPKGKITIVSPVKIPKKQALQVFQAILNLNGYNMVATSVSNLYRIVPLADASKSNLPIFLPEEKAPAAAENYIIKFLPLKYLDVQEATQLVQPLLSKESASVVAYQATNTLILVDTSLNIQRITRVLDALDVPSLEPEMEIVYMHNSAATDISSILAQIFSEAASVKGASASATPRPSTPGRPGTPQPAAPSSAGKSSSNAIIKIIPEQRLNALILIAPRDMLEQVKKVIAILDVQGGDKGVIHVYYCKNAVAKELAGTLAGLAGGSSGGAFRQMAGSSSRTSDTGMGTGSFGASTSGGTFGSGFGSSSSSRSSASGGATSATLSGGLFEGEIKITADESINSLIIVASPRDYEVLKKVIEQLDIPRRQVFVEAVLLQIGFDQNRSLGTSMHAGSSLPDGGMAMGSSASSALNSLGLLSLLSGAAGTTLPTGLTVAAMGENLVVPGTDGKVQIPSAGVIMQMLASDSNVNVLSAPTLLTTDNQDAEIQVGERIPMPTGSAIASGGVSSTAISRETVGIKLKINTQICESGTIRMEIATEISQAVPSSVGVNVNTLGVTTTLKTASTTVIVKDTQTIVIGGLMEDRRTSTIDRVPLIGDIPVLGWAFKNATKQRKKGNLIILITPHIVRSDEEVNNMRKQFKRDYDDFIEESFGEMEQNWNSYFQTQYQGTFKKATPRTEVDLTGDTPKVTEIPAAPEPGQPQPGGAAQPEPQDNSTVLSPGFQTPGPEQGPNLQAPPPATKKKWWQRDKNKAPKPKKDKVKK